MWVGIVLAVVGSSRVVVLTVSFEATFQSSRT